MPLLAPDVSKLALRKDVDGLIKALRFRDPRVRDEAARALGFVDDPRAVDALIAALGDRHAGVRRAALWGLRQHRQDARVGEALIAALKDVDPGVRAAAAESLGGLPLPDGRSAEALIAALKDASPGVRAAAAEAVGRRYVQQAVEPLIAALTDTDEYVRRMAAEALGKLGDARAVEPLVAALRDTGLGVPGAALKALSQLTRSGGGPGPLGLAIPIEPLFAALRDPMDGVPQAAAAMLGRWGDCRVVKRLIAETDRFFVADAAVAALESILARTAATCSEADLRTLARLANPQFGRPNVDFSRVRQLARDELIRRGLEA